MNLDTIQNSLGFSTPTSIGSFITSLFPYIFSLAGIVLLLYLIMGGLGLMTSAGDPKKVEASKQRITNAITGILIIFASFWIVQIISSLLGIEAFNIFK